MHHEAIGSLKKALKIGSKEMFLRSFMDEGESLSGLYIELYHKKELESNEKEHLKPEFPWTTEPAMII